MKCSKCGATLNYGEKFCTSCGASVDLQANASAQPPVSSPPPVYTAPPVYTPPVYTAPQTPPVPPVQQELAPVMTVGNFLGLFLLPALLNAVTCGIGGLILLLVWAFGSNVNPNKRNYAKAQLIFMLISMAIAVIVWIIMFVTGFSLAAAEDMFSQYVSYA